MNKIVLHYEDDGTLYINTRSKEINDCEDIKQREKIFITCINNLINGLNIVKNTNNRMLLTYLDGDYYKRRSLVIDCNDKEETED